MKNINVLIIDSDKNNWTELFEKHSVKDGYTYSVEQAEWSQFQICSYPDSTKTQVTISPNKKPLKGTKQDQIRTFTPDFVLIRKLVQGLKIGSDWRNILYGFSFGNVVCVNSVQSVVQCQERAVAIGEMKKIQKKLGNDKFPLIPMTYYSEPNQMLFTPNFPIVVKVGSFEAGFGKMKINDTGDLKDFGGVLTCYGDYVTAESYIKDKDYDIRIQKIGSHYRAYKRVSMVQNWKTNQGSSQVEAIKMDDIFKLWIDECSKLFGGMDILTVDAVHTKDGKYYILEINDTASGFLDENAKEDMEHVYEICLKRIKENF